MMKNKIKDILLKKEKKISLTAYSKPVAKILDKFCDIILVGDSIANVLYGMKNTHKLSLKNIIEHSLSVRKGVKQSILVVDLPKGTYLNSKIAKKCKRLLKEQIVML